MAIISCLFAVEHLLCIMLYVCLPIVIMITMHLYVYNINFSWSFASFFPPFSLLVFYSFILQVFATIFSFFSFLAVLYPRPTPIENKTIMKANERTKKRKRRMAEKKKSISKDTWKLLNEVSFFGYFPLRLLNFFLFLLPIFWFLFWLKYFKTIFRNLFAVDDKK